MKNRNQKLNLDFVSAFWIGICIGFLILALIFGIFSYGFGFEIDFGKSDSKIEIQNSGRLPGDDVEASGFAGNWNGNFDIENENQILNLTMVEYSQPPIFQFDRNRPQNNSIHSSW